MLRADTIPEIPPPRLLTPIASKPCARAHLLSGGHDAHSLPRGWSHWQVLAFPARLVLGPRLDVKPPGLVAAPLAAAAAEVQLQEQLRKLPLVLGDRGVLRVLLRDASVRRHRT